ncbi:MAG: protein translocase subunit SecF [Chloroflexaceae bacterium]|nr:protein translocase subunit SecF [Chloroflexaceae bacterium]
MEHLVRLRYWWFALSALIILPGLYFLLLHPLVTTGQFQLGLRTGIDFSGGSLWEIHFQERSFEELSTAEIAQVFEEQGFPDAQVQFSQITVQGQPIAAAIVRTRPLDANNRTQEQNAVMSSLNETFGGTTLESEQTVGATVSQESTQSAIIAVFGASIVILLYLTWAFRKAPHPVRYGICAIIAMLHDVLLILGVAAILGVFIGLEVDALFLTALLTILSFSVHDTIVVFDRIRENLISRRYGQQFDDLVNLSLVQTLTRSINTQMTTFFTLTSLLLFGGDSIRNFVLILLIGLISGTYSSIFNAAQFLVVWENREWQTWFGRGSSSTPVGGSA